MDKGSAQTESTLSTSNLRALDGEVIGSFRGEDYYIYTEDIQGSTGKILDDSLSAKNTYSYTDFGEVEVSASETNGNTTSLIANEICYTGAIYDETTGLHYLNARYYDPENGRFISQDTYRGDKNEISQWHLYAYCANNPINYTDPSGHWVKSVGVKWEIAAGVGMFNFLSYNWDDSNASVTLTSGIKFITNIGIAASVIFSSNNNGSVKSVPNKSWSFGTSYSLGCLTGSIAVSKNGSVTKSGGGSVGKWIIPFASIEAEFSYAREIIKPWQRKKTSTTTKEYKTSGVSYNIKRCNKYVRFRLTKYRIQVNSYDNGKADIKKY